MRESRRGKLRHPFRDFAKISNKGASRALQRRIVDFSAERSFQKTADALNEHYKIDIPIYTIDKVTSTISKEAKLFNSQVPENIKPAGTLISEVDGSMLPIVEFREKENDSSRSKLDGCDKDKVDRRKLRSCVWKEIRVSIVRIPGCVDAHYGVALGDPFTVGCMMYDCCKFKGLNDSTYIHAVSDGAPWIANQYKLQFGRRCKYFVDFYHVCEYLVAAAKSTEMELKERNLWLETQKKYLRGSEVQRVIKSLRDLDPSELADENHPVSIAIAYLQKRIHQLDYKDAIERELPIGSGEVESAHRHILQKRLKISGAWWRLERAEEIAQLRAMRANNHWPDFWQQKSA